MSLYSDIDALKSSVDDSTSTQLPPGYIVGFNLSISTDRRIYCGPGTMNFNGKMVSIVEGRYLLDSEWISKSKLASTIYYIYYSTGGAFFVDLNPPDFLSGQYGDYHPTLGYRYIGKCKTDKDRVISIVANSKNIIAENIDFEGISGDRIQANTIEAKQMVFGDPIDREGDPIPDTINDYFIYDNLGCSSHAGLRPVSKNVKLEQGDIGTVPNPWFYERRWTVPLGLVAAYTMDAGAGTVLRDDSGNFKDLTILGLTWVNDATKGYVLESDGAATPNARYARLAGTWNCGATITIAFWAKADALNNRMAFGFSYDGGAYGINLYFTGGTVTLNNGAGGGGSFGAFTDTISWHHFVVQINSADTRLYVDGASLGTTTYINPTSTNKSFQLFAWPYDYNYNWDGKIGKPHIYNRVLTTTEISALYAETSPYIDVYDPPCDNAIWMGKTTTNLVRSTDLNNAVWTKHANYHTNYGNIFDSELQKTVWKWNKGATTYASLIYDDAGFTSFAAGTYILTLMVRCNYDITIQPYTYNATPGFKYAPGQLVPANTWTLVTGRFTTAVTTYTQQAWSFFLPGSGNFPADIEFRACDPYVALESSPMPFVPTTRPAGSLWYNFTWPQQGTVGFWVKPGFIYNTGSYRFLLSDYLTSATHFNIVYDVANDKFQVEITGSTTVSTKSTAITSNADLWKWWFIAATWDVPNDSLKLYCYNADYPNGDNSASTSDLGTVTFHNYLEVGGIPLGSSPAGGEADSFMSGLFIDDTVWTEAELKAHYDTRRVYYDPNSLPNYNKGLYLDRNGIQIREGSLNITDNYGREIDISNQSGLLAKDASGQIIHDIPTAPVLKNAYVMGHLYLFDLSNSSLVLVSASAIRGSWSTITLPSYGIINLKGIRVKLRVFSSVASAGLYLELITAVRPYGTNWGYNSSSIPTGYQKVITTNNELLQVAYDAILDVPVVDNKFDWYTIGGTTTSTTISLLGYWV